MRIDEDSPIVAQASALSAVKMARNPKIQAVQENVKKH